ncbi:MAG: hypothetical protein M3O85_04410 [Acidobacteriota bacterium]|nr:hypothetical protein [Acidobacteriota bacterium]
MRRWHIVASLSLLALAGCTSEPPPLPAPQFGWKPLLNESFALRTAQFKWYTFKGEFHGRLRVTVNATRSVTFSVADSAGIGMIRGSANDPRRVETVMQQMPCFNASVLQSERECDAPGEIGLVIRDDRTAGDALIDAAAAWFGSKEAAARASADNRVSIALYRWDCIANCGPQTAPP